jgi:hypothetical protein
VIIRRRLPHASANCRPSNVAREAALLGKMKNADAFATTLIRRLT